jgi:hypothetical protein
MHWLPATVIHQRKSSRAGFQASPSAGALS